MLRKPGRPRKLVSEFDRNVGAFKPRKGRGRPPKHKYKLSARKSRGLFFDVRMNPETIRGIFLVIFFAFGVLSFLSLIGMAGKVGVGLSGVLRQLFGRPAYILPFVLIGLSVGIWRSERSESFKFSKFNIAGVVLFLLGLTGLFHIKYNGGIALKVVSDGVGGGYVGYAASYPLQLFMGFWATLLVVLALFLVGTIMMLNVSLRDVVEMANKFRLLILKVLHKQPIEGDLEIKGMRNKQGYSDEEAIADLNVKELGKVEGAENMENILKKTKKWKDWKPYPIDLLNGHSTTPMAGDIKGNARIIQQTLKSFGIEVKMHEVNVGPTVTQYTFKPMEGVKLSQIITLNNDLALALAAHPIRIEAPIPGKALVGVEVPNQKIAIVRLREILESNEFIKNKSKLSMAFGRDVAGSPVICELDKMPHLLISGATGSGKSICLNSIILSFLYQNSPDDLRLILVDPKKVEMASYNGIPNLMTPVVTEVDKTVNVLRWAVGEMERRFKVFAEARKRDIKSYNALVGKDRLPYIVIVIDELADLMAVAANEVEAAIVRLAQMARAVGIHLVLATQRPSVNVITGLIKANITARVAFAVASQIDSRTIIDMGGAERLLGNGDMLFISPDLGKPRRIQGAFVTEKDIIGVCNNLKEKGEPDYDETIIERQKKIISGGVMIDGDVDDELYEEAKETVLASGKASASLLQRRLRIGYARAARILDILEERGVVGPADGAKPREILAALDQNKEVSLNQFNSDSNNSMREY